MKKYILSSLLLLVALVSQAQSQEKIFKSYLSYSSFDVPGMTPFLETALAIESNSVAYKEFEKGKFKATVEITTIFKQNDTIRAFSKIALDSPIVTDTNKIDGAFINQDRFALQNGEYQMEISVTDLNNKKQFPFKSEQTVVIDYPKNQQSISDIILVESFKKAEKQSTFTKSGFDIVPMIYTFFPASSSKLTFYSEIYNSDKLYNEGKYLVNYYIQSFESGAKLNDFQFSKRVEVGPVNILMNTIDITELPSGNYYLVVETRDRANKPVASNSVFFQRSNPNYQLDLENLSKYAIENTFASEITNIDTLRENISSLDPLFSDSERGYVKSLVATDDLKSMQQFLYNFWAARNPLNPKDSWNEYNAQVKRVNMSFSTATIPGYKSDRGRVYLKYGTPDKIVESYNEPGAYPYEIWHFYQMGNQRNKKFVFMAKDIVTNDFHLIHSDAIGEVNNYRWQMEIYSRNYGEDNNYSIFQTTNPNAYGNRAGDYYDNPR